MAARRRSVGARGGLQDSMVWEKVARGTSVLSGLSSSTRAELHALRAGLASFFSLIADRGARDPKRVAVSTGVAIRARLIE